MEATLQYNDSHSPVVLQVLRFLQFYTTPQLLNSFYLPMASAIFSVHFHNCKLSAWMQHKFVIVNL